LLCAILLYPHHPALLILPVIRWARSALRHPTLSAPFCIIDFVGDPMGTLCFAPSYFIRTILHYRFCR
jgi:hypothetical protein